MKTLPTVELEDAMYDRIISAFGSEVEYIAFLARTISSSVSGREGQPLIDDAYQVQFDAQQEISESIFPTPVEEPIE